MAHGKPEALGRASMVGNIAGFAWILIQLQQEIPKHVVDFPFPSSAAAASATLLGLSPYRLSLQLHASIDPLLS